MLDFFKKCFNKLINFQPNMSTKNGLDGNSIKYDIEGFRFVYDKNTKKISLYDQNVLICDLESKTDITEKTKFTLDEVLTFIRPIVDISPYKISESFTEKEDPMHWQQPCCTEMMAFKLHEKINVGTNFDKERRIINTYVGIPWASFFDKRIYLGDIILSLKSKIDRYKVLAKTISYTLRVHTVCQSIHWKRHLDYFHQAGITDLHASHYSNVLTKFENPYGIRMHSWHLYAVNVEDSTRNKNITVDKDIQENPLLASFRGAHMIHYLSDVRLLLKNALAKDKVKTDVHVEVTDEWHFNREVFGKQVGALNVSPQTTDNDVYTYNELLCRSTFALCPEGAGINTIRFWEALAVGSIPVLILSTPHIPMLFRLHPNLHACCVVIFRDSVLNIFNYLRYLPKNVVKEKRQLCRQTYLEIRDQTAFNNQHNTLFGVF